MGRRYDPLSCTLEGLPPAFPIEVMVKRERDDGLRTVAARQHGAFSRRQVVGLGFTPTEVQRRISNGTWLRLGNGVYAVAGSVDSWERRAWARLLAAGEGAALSHEAAAYRHGLVDAAPTRIDVTVPFGRSRRGTHRARNFTRADIKLQGGMPVTCVARTIVDLAGVLPRHRLEDVLDRALLRGLVSISSMRRYIAARGLTHVRGAATLRRLLDDREGGVPASELERAFERVLLRSSLPKPDRQVQVGRFRIDFIYKDQRLWIELNGRKDHGRKAVFEEDHVRYNEVALALADHLHLRFTWTQVTKRWSYVADAVRRGLGR